MGIVAQGKVTAVHVHTAQAVAVPLPGIKVGPQQLLTLRAV